MSVSVQANGEKRLILDLRYLNKFRINICFWATELDIDLSYSITIPAR